MDLSALLHTMASMLAAMATGFFGAKGNMIDQNFNKQLAKILLTLIHPCSILSSVLGKGRSLSSGQVLVLILVSAGCYVVLIPLSGLFVRALRVPREDWGTYRYLMVFSNVGFMGYPVARTLFGAEAEFAVTIFVLMFQLVSYSFGIHLISDGANPFRFDPGIFRRPLVLAALAAMLLYLTGLRTPDLLSEMIQYVGKISTPLSMIILGCSLASLPAGEIFGNWRIYVLAAAKLLAIPILSFFVLRLLLPEPLLLGVTTVMLSMPAGTTAATLALAYGGNQKLASSGVFVLTLLSMATIPALQRLLFLPA